MRLLLQAIFRTKQHFMLLLGTFATLILLTVASQMEMFSLGILANNGSDFFSLFSSEQVGSSEGISLSEVQSQWPQVAEKDSSLITKQSAAMYLSSKKETNPLNWLLLKFQNSSFFWK
jgi:hypothetical protein